MAGDSDAFQQLLQTGVTTAGLLSISEAWRNRVGHGASVGLLDHPPRSSKEFRKGALDVVSWVQAELEYWTAWWLSEHVGIEPNYEIVIERLGQVFRQHDPRFLWIVLNEVINDASMNEPDSNENIWNSVISSSICQSRPDLPFRSSLNWAEGEQDLSCLKRNKCPYKRCIEEAQAAFFVPNFLQGADAQDALRDVYQLIPPEIYNEKSNALVEAIQFDNRVAILALLQISDGLDLASSKVVHNQLISGHFRADVEDTARVEIVRLILQEHSGVLIQEYLEAAVLSGNVDLVKEYYSKEALAAKESARTICSLICLDGLTDDELTNLPGFENACLETVNPNILLHLAVCKQRASLVEFLAEKTNAVSVKASSCDPQPGILGFQRDDLNGAYPLSYNKLPESHNTTEEANPVYVRWDRIQTAIKMAMIRQCEPVTIDEILKTCKDSTSGGQLNSMREYILDLTGFDAQNVSFSDFLDAFLNEEQEATKFARNLQFEPILKYMRFPEFPSDFTDATSVHSEVSRVLEWLEKRGVKTILHLIVPDRLWGSHSERFIAETVTRFEVEILDWRCQDFSFTHLKPQKNTPPHVSNHAGKYIKQLHLYSSGKSAVHQYWLGLDGLTKLENLEKVSIHVIEDFLSKEAVREATKELQTLKHEFLLGKGNGLSRNGFIRITSFRSPRPRRILHGDSLHNMSVLPKDVIRVYDQADICSASRAFPKLSRFLSQYRTLKPSKRTKVAVIDNGIMATARNTPLAENLADFSDGDQQATRSHAANGSILHHVVAGKSFVHSDGRLSSWFVAKDPHGSQMAALICALDPLCEIVVAQVAERRSDIFPERVAAAIYWAINQGVDVISMSFVCEKSTDLTRAVKEAENKNILMFASCHDEGFNRPEVVPAQYHETFAIAACGPQGDVIYNIPQTHYQYRLPGRDVFVGRVAHMDSREKITGSSVATATASGLASLVLSCLRICACDCDSEAADLHGSGAQSASLLRNGSRMKDTDVDSSNSAPSTRKTNTCPARHLPSTSQTLPSAYKHLRMPDTSDHPGWRTDIIKCFFRVLSSEDDAKYIILNKFCGLNQKLNNDLEFTDMAEFIFNWCYKHFPFESFSQNSSG